MVTVCVPATTANLGPGFDTLGMALNLFNYIEMDLGPPGLDIEVHGEGQDIISRGKDNIVYQAARKVWDGCGFDYTGIKIKLNNNIPLARGLGSSAAAITGGMVAANALAGYPLAVENLLDIATDFEGHPDNVAPALLGGLVMSVLQEDKVYCHKVEVNNILEIGAVIPHFTLATETGRQVLPEQVLLKDAIFNVSRTAFLMTAFLQGEFHLLNYGMEDRLHQPYRARLIPGMEKALQKGKDAGAYGVALSGSGPTIVAFASHNVEAICDIMQDAFHEEGLEASVMRLKPENTGTRVINGGLKKPWA